MKEEKSGGEKSERDWDGEGSQMEPQGSSQLYLLSYQKGQPTSIATCLGH